MPSLSRQDRSTLQRRFPRSCRSRAAISHIRRIDVAAVCYRVRSGEPEFLLVRSRNGCWTFPKGGLDQDATTAEAAAREAYEEAGVLGLVERAPFTSYRHRKTRRVVLVHAHLFKVEDLQPPMEDHRDPTWFSMEKAKRRLQKYRTPEFATEVSSVIDRAAELIIARA